jgi:hypothetical protein
MYLDIIREIEEIQTVAVGGRIQDIMRIRKQYGPGRWRKLKGVANVRLQSGRICKAEVHWYEAHGVGRKKIKIKRILD